MPYKIAIIGAGPVGCMLARLLTHSPLSSNLSVTIFEGEQTLDFRSQGGSLDLHEQTGQLAIREAGLFDEWLQFARYDGEALKLCDKNMVCYITRDQGKHGSSKNGRPEIDRPQLRKMLFDSLPEGTVRWGHKLVRVDEDRNLHFANGRTESGFDLIVGADGAWSRVRPVLTEVSPEYSGVGGVAFLIHDAQARYPKLYDLVNRGSVFAWSDGKSLSAQFMSDGSINVYTFGAKDSDWQAAFGSDIHNAAAMKENCLREYADWDPRLTAFISAAGDDIATARDLYMLPVGMRWDHRPGVTLVGDAAHLMTPFAGEGVNLGLRDSLELSRVILSTIKHPQNMTLDSAVDAFERDMFVRATKFQQLTLDLMNFRLFTPGAPHSNIEEYILRIASKDREMLRPVLKPLVYGYYLYFRSFKMKPLPVTEPTS